MQPVCEGHPQVVGRSAGLHLVLRPPEVEEEPVLQGEADVDAAGASIYGSVIRDGGRFRMWYQAWPRDWDGTDVLTVACVESEDGHRWHRPAYGLVECCGSRANPLTDLPFHSPSVLLDPTAGPEARYRAFGYCRPERLRGRFAHRVEESGYFTAHSADGVHWELDPPRPLLPDADVITSAWDPWSACARLCLKRNGLAAGLHRRRFYTATWAGGQLSEPVSALVPDEWDDAGARSRGFHSADYYGAALLPTPGPTLAILWTFRHLLPLGHLESHLLDYGSAGRVDLSLVCQPERGGRWLHLPGRPDWLPAAQAPPWARGSLYTAASPLDVGEETWLYFTGTVDQHGRCGVGRDYPEWCAESASQGGFSRIGLLRWPRLRLMGYRATLAERLQLVARRGEGPGRLAVNVACRTGGCLRARLLDGRRQALPGYGFEACVPVHGDALDAQVHWLGRSQLPVPSAGYELVAELELVDGTLYAFEFTCA
ncbi:MAG: hypothetical protein AB1505_33445 [Candidatus Latescibacterota bacterium]